MTAPQDARDLVAAAEQLDDQGADRLRELRARQAQLQATQAQERAAIESELIAAEARFNAHEAERLHAERVAAEREAQRAAAERAAQVAARNEELTLELTTQSGRLVDSFYNWLAEAPPNEGPVRIVRRDDPVYPGAVAAMIADCHDPRLRFCRMVAPAP